MGGVLNSGTINLEDSSIHAVVGDNGTIFVGNKSGGGGGFNESSYNGRLDQIAFWNRELTAGEIAAQFNMLPHGPSFNFDLTLWNLMLPVNSAGGFSGSPRVVDTAQLSSGFQYVEPTPSCTKRYFYRGGGDMVFEAPHDGAGDPPGAPRSELRETLTNGDEYNWIPGLGETNTLNGTCRVNGAGQGKIVIGQIHAKTPKAGTVQNPTDPVPAVILYYDNRTDPNNPNDPNKPYIKVSVYDSPTGFDTDSPLDGKEVEHYTVLTRVQGAQEDADLTYELKIAGDASLSMCHLFVTVNNQHPKNGSGGEVYPIDMDAKDRKWFKTAPQNPPATDTDDATRLYFKAGCYYPEFTGTGVTPKVTFSNLAVQHLP